MNIYLRAKQFTLKEKSAAFLRGMATFSPLVEVAKDGITKGYSLDRATEAAYAERLASAFTTRGLANVLSRGCPESAQEVLAFRIARLFGREMLALHRQAILANLSCRSHSSLPDHHVLLHKLLSNNPEAKNMLAIRAAVSDTLVAGAITSAKAQMHLMLIFHHAPLYDIGQSHLDNRLPAHIKRLMECGTLSPSSQSNLMKNLADVRCEPCQSMFGIDAARVTGSC